MPPSAPPVDREPSLSVTADLRNESTPPANMVTIEQGCAQRAGSFIPGPQTPAHNTTLVTGLEASPPTSDHGTGSSTVRVRAQQMVSGIRRIISGAASSRLSSAPTLPIQATLACDHLFTSSIGDNISTAPPPPSRNSLQQEHSSPAQPASASAELASAFPAAASHHRAVATASAASRSGLASCDCSTFRRFRAPLFQRRSSCPPL